jgi:hypothetical protein
MESDGITSIALHDRVLGETIGIIHRKFSEIVMEIYGGKQSRQISRHVIKIQMIF